MINKQLIAGQTSANLDLWLWLFGR